MLTVGVGRRVVQFREWGVVTSGPALEGRWDPGLAVLLPQPGDSGLVSLSDTCAWAPGSRGSALGAAPGSWMKGAFGVAPERSCLSCPGRLPRAQDWTVQRKQMHSRGGGDHPQRTP